MIKSILRLVLSLGVALCLLSVQAIASEPVSVKIDSTYAEPGQTVTVPIVLANNTGFSDLSIQVCYDADALRLIAVEANEQVGGYYTPAQTMDAVPYHMSWTNGQDLLFNGTLATLTFEVLTERYGTYDLSLSCYEGRDGDFRDGEDVNLTADFQPLGLCYQSGAITVGGGRLELLEGGTSMDFSVSLSGRIGQSVVYAARYSKQGKLMELQFANPTASELRFRFSGKQENDQIKVFWLDAALAPKCAPLIVSQ